MAAQATFAGRDPVMKRRTDPAALAVMKTTRRRFTTANSPAATEDCDLAAVSILAQRAATQAGEYGSGDSTPFLPLLSENWPSFALALRHKRRMVGEREGERPQQEQSQGQHDESCKKVKPTILRARRPRTPSSGSIQNGLIMFGRASAEL